MAAPANPTGGGRRYGGRSPEERRADRRERLLQAALELFGTKGYTATSISELCAEAGVTARHLYEEFGSRDAVLLALFEQIVHQAVEAVGTTIATVEPTRDALTRHGVSSYIHALLDDPRKARVQCIEMIGVSPDLERRRRELLRSYADLLAAQDRVLMGDVPPPSAVETTYITIALAGGIDHAMIEWLSDPDPPPIDEFVRVCTEILLAVGRHYERLNG
jgi:AcrR family transcriptional regulator